MPIVWEWLEAPDHTRRTRGNANLHGAAGEGSREGSPVRVFNQSLRYTSHCFRHRPFFFCLHHTHRVCSPHVYHSQVLCFRFHSPFENQWAALVPLVSGGQVKTAFSRIGLHLTADAVCLQMYVCICDRIWVCVCSLVWEVQEQCGRTLREGYAEDNNSSKSTDAGFN